MLKKLNCAHEPQFCFRYMFLALLKKASNKQHVSFKKSKKQDVSLHTARKLKEQAEQKYYKMAKITRFSKL